MTTIYISATDQVLVATRLPKVGCNNQNTVKLHVEFDSAWSGYAKSAAFFTSKDPTPYEVILSSDGNCLVPAEVLIEEATLYIGVRGVKTASGEVKSSTLVRYKVLAGTPSMVVSDPTPSVYQQLLNENAMLKARVSGLEAGGTVDGSEVIGIRTGMDGTQYDTAGDAVREQFADVHGSLSAGSNIHAKECGYLTDVNRRGLWEQGWVSSNTGETGNTGTDNDIYIRLKDFVSSDINMVRAENDYRLAVYVYDLGGVFESRIAGFLPEYVFDHTAHKYRVAMTGPTATIYNGTGTPITPEDAPRAHLLTNPVEMATVADVQRCASIAALRYGYRADYNSRILWEQGYIDSLDGMPGYKGDKVDYTGFIRTTDFVPSTVSRIVADAGYVFNLYGYDLEGTYKERLGEKLTDYSLNHSEYKYKIGVCRSDRSLPMTRAECLHIGLFGEPDTGTHFAKDVNFGQPPTGAYYKGMQAAYNVFNGDTKTADVIAAFDKLVAANAGYCVKKQIGEDCEGSAIYSYTFKPTTFSGTKSKPIPKIIIAAGAHGFEKSNVFGLYYFLSDMCNRWYENAILEYLRHNVELVVVPVVTPSAFDANTYKNSAGVNINRNYDLNWRLVEDATSDSYGGAAPFDQPESRAVRDLVLENLDAFFFIDSHSCGSGCVPDYPTINWHAYCYTDDSYYRQLADACCTHIANMTAHFNRDYSLKLNHGVTCGKYTGFVGTPGNGCCDNWVMEQGIMAMTFEGFNGFPNGSVHSANVQKANSELIGNWLLTVVNQYK